MLMSLYIAALFLSAFLLFWIEPLFTKMALPLLGGAPAVWNTALMFFQLMLLAGYGYAHLLTRHVAPRWQFWIHAAVAAAGLAVLPIGIASGWRPPGDRSPVFWLIGLLAASLGLPFFALAASAPLLQVWFARTGHAFSRDPYFLYAASNLGSLVALAAFPALFEPTLSLGRQSLCWAVLYGALLVLVAGCAWRARNGAIPVPEARSTGAPDWRRAAVWIALAAVPSSLLLGVTSYITTDIASVPLLWVAPLALYLLTFIIAFSPRLRPRLDWLLKAQAAGLVLIVTLLLLALVFGRSGQAVLLAPAHLAAFFLSALVCHIELAARRPGIESITLYYFCMSLGGALGGLFNALLAPLIFSGTYEYYLGLVAACALRGLASTRPERWRLTDAVVPGLLALPLLLTGFAAGDPHETGLVARAAVLLVCALLLYAASERAGRFALGMAVLLGGAVALDNSVDVLHQDRSFFGVNRVKRIEDGSKLALFHGTTMHGTEFTDPALWHEPLAYYSREGPAGQLLSAAAQRRAVTLIGLGTGALACYRQPGESWRFLEIDPAVERIARDTRYFHYLSDCAGDSPVILGDGRLSLQAVPDGSQDILVVDAFSSDAIPIHLLTREALQLYLQKLAPHGIVLLHISNQHLALAPIVGDLAASVGASARHQLYTPSAAARLSGGGDAEWAVIGRQAGDLDFLDARWEPLVPRPGVAPWTDDFSNIFEAIR